MRGDLRLWVCAVAALACGGKSSVAPDSTGASGPPPPVKSDWTYFGPSQGLGKDVRDVSADEGGNVYVAAYDAVYAKPPADQQFLRFDASSAGLTQNCNDPPPTPTTDPTKPFYMCPVISIAGAAPGKAIVGFEGLPLDYDSGPLWVLWSGGVDVVAFDPEKRTMARTRHAAIATPPHVICESSGDWYLDTCPGDDWWWENGRRLFRQTRHIVVNHDRSSPMYGDAWMGGNHGTFAVLLANAAQRGWVDRTQGWGQNWTDAKDVWEHAHPEMVLPSGEVILLPQGDAISIDPRNGVPWGSNRILTAWVGGYGADLSTRPTWWLGPRTATSLYIDIWPDDDEIRSMSHCPDGTLWIGSAMWGLARIAPDGTTITRIAMPDGYGPGVSAVACDPNDASVWMGLVNGGIARYRDGAFSRVDATGAPSFASHPVASIQLDPWSTPRAIWFAFGATRDASGQIADPGGAAVYRGQ